MRTVRPVAAALVALALASACAPDGSSALESPPLVLVLRSTPDPHHTAFVTELRNQRFALGRAVELQPGEGEAVYADAGDVADAAAALEREPAVVVAYSTPLAEAAVDLFPEVPTVTVVNDPVASGLVVDRARPEGQVTGVTFASPPDRTLDLAGRLVGGVERIGYLAPASEPAVAGHQAGILAAADEAGLDIVGAAFDGPSQVAAAVDRLVAAEVDLVVLATANGTVAAYDQLRTALADAALPTVANDARADFAVLALEPDGAELRRQVARQVARLLNGDPVAQVPVEDPRRFRVVIDRADAARVGVESIDGDLLRQADDVR